MAKSAPLLRKLKIKYISSPIIKQKLNQMYVQDKSVKALKPLTVIAQKLWKGLNSQKLKKKLTFSLIVSCFCLKRNN